EDLHFTGRVHVLVKDGNRSGFHLNPNSLVGVGVDTGTKYYGHGPTRSFVVNTPSGNTIVQAIDFGALVVKKGRPNVRFHFQTHITVNANGDITADHSKNVVECQ
ncbi:MAG: hypothetical protein R3195_16665, partial [Gemmatimonadota bacterium]|nr:hypothetical protein [Gemmatimonadota bacterium]